MEKNERHWHALYVKPRAEKKVAERLLELGTEVYLPLVTTVKQWSDRKKRVDEPLFKSYVFVHATSREHYPILLTDGVMRFVTFENKAVVVPDSQILAIGAYIDDYEENRKMLETAPLREGQRVRITEGPMTGLEGRLANAKDGKRLIVYIDAVGQYLSITIPRAKLEPVV